MISAEDGEKILMGGVGSGSWYRFEKKTTTGECDSVDLRYLHRNGLLKPGSLFSLRWSRAVRTGSLRGMVSREGRPEQITFPYRHRSELGGEWEDVKEPMPLSWTACNSAQGGRGVSSKQLRSF